MQGMVNAPYPTWGEVVCGTPRGPVYPTKPHGGLLSSRKELQERIGGCWSSCRGAAAAEVHPGVTRVIPEVGRCHASHRSTQSPVPGRLHGHISPRSDRSDDWGANNLYCVLFPPKDVLTYSLSFPQSINGHRLHHHNALWIFFIALHTLHTFLSFWLSRPLHMDFAV